MRFIEYMPFDGNVWSDSKMVSYREMMAAVAAAFPQGLERCADPRGEVAKNFRVGGLEMEGGDLRLCLGGGARACG